MPWHSLWQSLLPYVVLIIELDLLSTENYKFLSYGAFNAIILHKLPYSSFRVKNLLQSAIVPEFVSPAIVVKEFPSMSFDYSPYWISVASRSEIVFATL